MMKVHIENLKFEAILGILPFERANEQLIVVDVSFEYEYSKDEYVDYASVCECVKTIIKQEKFHLIEEAIIKIEDKLNSIYEIDNLFVKISKPDILPDCVVGVSNF